MKGRIYTWSDDLGYYADIHGEICEADEVVAASHARESLAELENEIEILRFAGDVQGERLTAEIEWLRRLLYKYGSHADGCPVPVYGSDRECTCGWREIDKPGGLDAALIKDTRAAIAGADQQGVSHE